MVLTSIMIGVAFFAGLLALLGASYRDAARAMQERSAEEHEHTAGPGGTECLLCRAPLPRVGTADEAVTEIERRIAADRRDAGGALGGTLARSYARTES